MEQPIDCISLNRDECIGTADRLYQLKEQSERIERRTVLKWVIPNNQTVNLQ